MRIACPSCDAPLTVSERGAGKIVKCPRCHERMRVPELPPAPLPVAKLLPPMNDDLEIVRSISQAKPRPPRLVDDEILDEPFRCRPTPIRRPPPKGVSVGWIAAGLLAGVISFVGIALWWASRPGPTVAKKDTAKDMPASISPQDKKVTKESPPKDEIAVPAKPPQPSQPSPAKSNPQPEPGPPLPSGWSYNATTMGFRAAFPVAPGENCLTPTSFFTKQGTTWFFSQKLAKGEQQIWMVDWNDLPDTDVKDVETALDNYVRKKQSTMKGVQVKKLTHRGLPARELSYIAGRVEANRERVLIHGKRLWILFTNTESTDRETIDRFLDSFLPLSKSS